MVIFAVRSLLHIIITLHNEAKMFRILKNLILVYISSHLGFFKLYDVLLTVNFYDVFRDTDREQENT